MNFIGLSRGRNEVTHTKQDSMWQLYWGAKALGSSSSFVPMGCVTLDKLLAISGLQSLHKIITTIISTGPAGYAQLRPCGEDSGSSSRLSW